VLETAEFVLNQTESNFVFMFSCIIQPRAEDLLTPTNTVDNLGILKEHNCPSLTG